APLVAEELRQGHARQPDALSNARWLVHLAEDQRHLVDDARLLHLAVEVIALARALAHTGEDRVPTVLLGDVADQLLDDDGLADTRAAEDSNLAAFTERGDQVDHLDASFELLGLHGLVDQRRRRAMDRVLLAALDIALAVDRFAEDVEQPPQGRRT